MFELFKWSYNLCHQLKQYVKRNVTCDLVVIFNDHRVEKSNDELNLIANLQLLDY